MDHSVRYKPVIHLASIKAPHIRLIPALPSSSDAIAVMLPQKTTAIPATLQALDLSLGGALQKALSIGDFTGKAGSVTVYAGHQATLRLLLAGLGQPDELDADQLRWTAAAIARKARDLKLRLVTLHLTELETKLATDNRLLEAVAEGLTLGCFKYDTFKAPTDSDDGVARNAPEKLPTFQLFLSPGKPQSQFVQAISTGKTIAQATNYARFIACHPGNVVDPAALIQEARALAADSNLRVEIIDHKKARALGMGGLLSVGQGSISPPALILLEHRPKSAAGRGRMAPPVVLVGKAVTFDTGGISIKPAANMGLMKYDKCGGMAVLGAMKAIADLHLPVHVIGAIPTAENSVDALAYRPGDIIRMFNGKTVEVTNTDAEGRLILADALSYVCRRYQPQAVIDLATLTGGVIVALGSVYAGLMANQDELALALEAAGTYTGEWLWRLPLHDRYTELLKSAHADITNSGAREAHPIQGGMFLRHFVPVKTPWAHLDIAGTSNPEKDDRYLVGKSASGFGVRLLVEYLRRQRA